MAHLEDQQRDTTEVEIRDRCARVRGNSLLPQKLRVTREELVSYSSEKLSITSDEVVSLRSKFLEITDGDLLSFCTRLLVQSSGQAGNASKGGKGGKGRMERTSGREANEIQEAVRRIYALGQAVCSMKHASLKLATEHEFGEY